MIFSHVLYQLSYLAECDDKLKAVGLALLLPFKTADVFPTRGR